ncbi:hypothetical protein AgCh_038974 [Apium graveolens]
MTFLASLIGVCCVSGCSWKVSRSPGLPQVLELERGLDPECGYWRRAYQLFESGLSQEFPDEDESRGTETQGWSPLLLAPNDNSGEWAAPSDGVPGSSVRGFLLTSTSEVYGDPLQHPQVETYWCNVNPVGGPGNNRPKAKIEFRPNTEDDPHMRKPDIKKAKDLLGWEPKVPLTKGLPLMVSNFRQCIFGDQKDGYTIG